MKLKDISTPVLTSYMEIVDNCYSTAQQTLNSIEDVLSKKMGTLEDFKKEIADATRIRQEHLDISVEIQKELDVRLKSDLGLERGIRKTQILLVNFEQKLTQLSQKEKDKWNQNLTIAKEGLEDVATEKS